MPARGIDTDFGWVEHLGYFNLGLGLLFPYLLLQKLVVPICDQIVAGSNRWALMLLGLMAMGALCLEFNSARSAGHRRRSGGTEMGAQGQGTWPDRLLLNLQGLLVALMFLAHPAIWLAYLLSLGMIRYLRWCRRQACLVGRTRKSFLIRLSPVVQWLGALYVGVWLAVYGYVLAFPSRPIDCALPKSVQANMHTFQTIVEAYNADLNALPASTKLLHQYAASRGYCKDFTNPMLASPFQGQAGYAKSYLDYSAYLRMYQPESVRQFTIDSVLGIYLGLDLVWRSRPDLAGLVLYDYRSLTDYRVYGTDRHGRLLRLHDKIFYLRPS